MVIDRKLLERAREAPHALGYQEAVLLCRQLGFEKVRQVRGHRIFRRPMRLRPLNLQQSADGRAKGYQVEHLLAVDAARTPPAGRLVAEIAGYRVSWSERDNECVAVRLDTPGLSGLGPTPERALAEVETALAAWRDYLGARGFLTTGRGR